MKQMVGITGGIGSGKSTVCMVFEKLGASIFHADGESKLLINQNPELRCQLINEFGNQLYKQDKIDRELFADIIFNDPRKLQKANGIIHPYVFKRFENWVTKQSSGPVLMLEAAILFETDFWKRMDRNILVIAPLDMRILRVMKRDNVEKEKVLERIRQQKDDKGHMQLADFIINNDEKEMLLPQILKVWKSLLS